MSPPSTRRSRSPEFLSQVSKKGVRPLFPANGSGITSLFGASPQAAQDAREHGPDATQIEVDPPELPAGNPAPLPAASAMSAEATENLARAIAELRGIGERCGSELAATALEIALLVARKIIDAEIRSDGEVARRLIKAAVRRLGDVHKVTIHVSPADAEAIQGVAGEGISAELGVARVEIIADTNLTAGDCTVETDAATVDGRIGTRVEELRRVLEAAINEESSTS